MKLIVVESPGKIRKIQGFLGSGEYRVAASFGHVRDLPERDIGVSFVDGKVDVTYKPVERNRKHIVSLKAAAQNADEIILATDPDREGEAIAWHVRTLLGKNRPYSRIEFNQITKPAVLAALRKPRQIDDALVDAQQARRVLDRLVGWMVSPVCWKHLGSGTSAGRVQSVAVRLVVEREREIRNFKVEVYHELWAWLWPPSERVGIAELDAVAEIVQKLAPGPKGAFRAKLIELNGKPVERTLVEAKWALDLRTRFLGADWRVQHVEHKERMRHAPPPFVTSTLQQAASNVMRWKPRNTMRVAQALYEAGLITYMRTDSPSCAPEAVRAARDWIAANFPAPYLPASPRYYKAKSAGAQEAHECVRPTDISKTPDSITGQKPDAARLYKLIWERTVASQMAAAVYDDTVARIDGNAGQGRADAIHGLFEAKGSVQRFAGWLALTQRESDREDERRGDDEPDHLPVLNAHEALTLARLDARKAQTEPPRRYSQAALIRALEKEGIGRPATYASIMDTIITRGYVEEIERSLHATGLGEALVDLLLSAFGGHFIELGFTRDAETALDRVAEGQQDWHSLVLKFRESIDQRLNQAGSLPIDPRVRRAAARGDSPPVRGGGKKDGRAKGTGGAVPSWANGESKGISEENDRGSEGEIPGRVISKMSDLPPVPLDRDCPLCGKKLQRVEGRYGKYVTCSAGKACAYKGAWLNEKQQAQVDAMNNAPCPKCGGPMSAKVAKTKKSVFLSCLKYPTCDGLLGVDGPKKSGGGRFGGGRSRVKSDADDDGNERDESEAPLAPVIALHPTRGTRAPLVPLASGEDSEDEAEADVPTLNLPTSRFGMPKSERASSGGLKRTKGLTSRTPLRPISKKKQAERAAGIRESRDTLRGGGFGRAKAEKPAMRFGPVQKSAGEEAAPSPGEVPHCPRCDAPMVLRKSARGPFYGCSLFPNCRGTKPLG